jgi:hypothetical protein
MQRDLKKFDIREEVKEAIVVTNNDVAKLNRKQLYEGQTANGTPIQPAYTWRTVFYKNIKGQPSDRVTLKDKGDFYNSIKVNVKTDTFDIIATDYKSDALHNKYGKSILGMTDVNRTQYIQQSFFPELQNRITSKLGYKFG